MAAYGKQQDNKQQASWERTRWLATMLLQPHTKKGQNLTPEKLANFPWEKENISEHFNKEKLEENIKYAEQNNYLSFEE